MSKLTLKRTATVLGAAALAAGGASVASAAAHSGGPAAARHDLPSPATSPTSPATSARDLAALRDRVVADHDPNIVGVDVEDNHVLIGVRTPEIAAGKPGAPNSSTVASYMDRYGLAVHVVGMIVRLD